MEYEEFILPDCSPPDDPARPCRPKAGYGLVNSDDDDDGGAFSGLPRGPRSPLSQLHYGVRPVPI